MDSEMMPKMGEVLRVGRRLYTICPECRALICLNKPIFGSLHLCNASDDEMR